MAARSLQTPPIFLVDGGRHVEKRVVGETLGLRRAAVGRQSVEVAAVARMAVTPSGGMAPSIQPGAMRAEKALQVVGFEAARAASSPCPSFQTVLQAPWTSNSTMCQ